MPGSRWTYNAKARVCPRRRSAQHETRAGSRAISEPQSLRNACTIKSQRMAPCTSMHGTNSLNTHTRATQQVHGTEALSCVTHPHSFYTPRRPPKGCCHRRPIGASGVIWLGPWCPHAWRVQRARHGREILTSATGDALTSARGIARLTPSTMLPRRQGHSPANAIDPAQVRSGKRRAPRHIVPSPHSERRSLSSAIRRMRTPLVPSQRRPQSLHIVRKPTTVKSSRS